MSNNTYTGGVYSLKGSVDSVNDIWLVQNGSVYYQMNRNILLGITGQPVDTTTTQTISGKTLTSPTINGATLSGTLSGTYVIGGTPTFPSSVVLTTGTQTISGKTLTSPTITSPNITNASLTADSISGYTTANAGTIYGIAVSGGTINSSSAIGTGIILPSALISGTGSTWVWQSWTPTWTGGMTIGNATINGRYTQIGKTIFYYLSVTWGSTSSLASSADTIFTLPAATISSLYTQYASNIGNGNLLHSATTTYSLSTGWYTTTAAVLQVLYISSSNVIAKAFDTSNLPSPSTGDVFTISGFYESS